MWTKENLKRKFLPSNYRLALFQKFHSLREYNKYMDENTKEFYMLQAQNYFREDDEQIVA